MPSMTGGNLKDKVVQEGPLVEIQASFYIAGVFSALQYLHSIRIVHRDLKVSAFV
jgi:serine/threonine protein kinase